jgi:integrase
MADRTKLTDTAVRTLPLPDKGSRIVYDGESKGFGCRVTAGGARSFVLNYRSRDGRERRMTIGAYPAWKVAAARQEAAELRRRIDRGEDPVGDAEAARAAPDIAGLCARFLDEYVPALRPKTRVSYESAINRFVLPALRHVKVDALTYSDAAALHRKVTKESGPYAANRAVATLSRMMSLAVRWGWRADNPVRGIERNTEEKRERFLSGAELARLMAVLADYRDRQAADIVRLLLLTGARKGEVLAMRWEHLDMQSGAWSKPAAATKQGKPHRVPISAPARLILAGLRDAAAGSEGFVFPGARGGHREDIKSAWPAICKAAGIADCRIHDLRHTYASILASAGLSLPVIGGLLGHTQPATTARYAHLLDDPLRAATERAAAAIARPEGEVVPFSVRKA